MSKNMNLNKTVLIIGGTSIDTIVKLPEPITGEPKTIKAKSYKAVGGTGAGKALNLARLGFPIFMHTILGRDIEAEQIIKACDHPNIKLLVDYLDEPTEQHTNLMSPTGERISIYTVPPCESPELDWSFLAKELDDVGVAAISILNYTRPSLSIAKSAGKQIWIDLHDYDGVSPYYQEFIDAADVIFMASDNFPDYQNFMREQIVAGKLLVVCTHGRAGSTALDAEGNWFDCGIAQGYTLIDSNGAGDAYFSGFLYAYGRDKSIAECMKYGATAAAMCINSEYLYHQSLSPEMLEKHYQAQRLVANAFVRPR
jgi:sugar/nucleoside kinase (ribokinase family)